MPELIVTLDALTGTVLIEEHDRLPKEFRDRLMDFLGSGAELGCARPLALLPPPEAPEQKLTEIFCVRVAGYYHNSLIEGPGRRSSVLLSGCKLACPGCWVLALHSPEAGTLVPVDRLAEALLDPAYERDGVSILGGEPFLQPEGATGVGPGAPGAWLLPHRLLLGLHYEALLRRAIRQPAIARVLDDVDVLIDGPYIEALADGAGPWTGSSNQRVIDLGATRRAGQVVLLDE